jgi:two-component system, OmpR family, KDP operon response regulator KdpE
MSERKPRILVIDDEPQILRFLRTSLTANGYDVIEAGTVAEGRRLADREQPDLIVLDLGLPDGDGKEVLRHVRAQGETPVLILSARDREAEKVEALDLGADDYVNKPFGIEELTARLRAALRHRLRQQGEQPVFKQGDLSVDIPRRIVKRGEETIHLTPKEFDLLRLFVKHAGKVLTQRQILQDVWGPAHTSDAEYLRVYIGQLRRKLHATREEPIIETEQGVGYRLRLG